MIGAISNALSGLMASTKRVEASASNIANISSTGSLDPQNPNQPYTPLVTVQKTHEGGGVSAQNIPRANGIQPVFDPASTFANADGLVGAPAVDLAEEGVLMKTAALTYKANLRVLETAQDMAKEMGRLFDERT